MDKNVMYLLIAIVVMCGVCIGLSEDPATTNTPTQKDVFPITYPVKATFIIEDGGSITATLIKTGQLVIQTRIGSYHDAETGRWQLESLSESRRRYIVYDSDGEPGILVLLPNGKAIADPETDNILGNWVQIGNTETKTNGYAVNTPIPTPTPTPPIPSWYYDDDICDCQIPVDDSLIDWLTEYEWANKYERGEWDCSQMTAALEWHLENCGYKTVMKQGTGPGGGGHAWVLIWLPKGIVLSKEGHTAPKDGYYIYEATGRYFVTDPAKWYGYQDKHQFDDIYAAWDYYKDVCLSNGKCGEEAFLDEYGWWE
ncbi:MAG: hypothetical protein WBD09_00260 [Halobacteriota archaeon]